MSSLAHGVDTADDATGRLKTHARIDLRVNNVSRVKGLRRGSLVNHLSVFLLLRRHRRVRVVERLPQRR